MKGQQIGLFEGAAKGGKVAQFSAAPAREMGAVGGPVTPEAERLLANFEVLAEALGGVKRLREMILDLAITGKLTQMSKLPTGIPTGEHYEPTFPLSEHWVWSPLGRLCQFIDYRGRTPAKTASGVPLITAKNVRMGHLREEPREHIAESEFGNWMTRGLPVYGDVLFTTEAPLGNVAQLLTRERVALAQRIIALHPISRISGAYLALSLMSPLMQASIRAKATGTTAQGIKAAKLRLIPVPVPMEHEQESIVDKVQHLMALCDDLEAKQAKKREVGDRLTKAALGALTSAEGPEEFAAAWKRVAENWQELIDRPEKLPELRQTLIDLSVSGRLIRPTTQSSERVQQALAACVHIEGERLNVGTSEPRTNWVQVPLRIVLAQPLANGRSVPDDPNGFPVLRLSALRGKYVDFAEHKLGAWNAKDAAPFIVQEGDLLFVRGNGAIRLVGRACIAHEPPARIAFPDTSIRGRPNLTLIEPLWLWYAWESQSVRQQIETVARTTAGIYKVSQDDLYKVRLLLPTLKEQRHVLVILERLMKSCDDLEAKLRTRDEKAAKLADALVAELVG
jgi:type I restriction enzyme, S subunit